MMTYPPGDSLGYKLFKASIVDSYKSPSRRSTASFSIGATGNVSLNQPEIDDDIPARRQLGIQTVQSIHSRLIQITIKTQHRKLLDRSHRQRVLEPARDR